MLKLMPIPMSTQARTPVNEGKLGSIHSSESSWISGGFGRLSKKAKLRDPHRMWLAWTADWLVSQDSVYLVQSYPGRCVDHVIIYLCSYQAGTHES